MTEFYLIKDWCLENSSNNEREEKLQVGKKNLYYMHNKETP